ncbi:unnamed protein product [Calicophoron daubneyi]|uniref:Mitochondrial assembly of ribosomal large subunit protein 1 n=1 Tax=Calicophoron daubneyi TaxID=300641 RepID=A0AAV2TCA2_CALDB
MRPCRQWKYFGLLFRLRGQCFRAFSSSSRFFCSKDEGSITQKNLMSCARDKTDEHTVIEVYDPPFESQWEEDPEFDYTNGQVQPLTYDFISQDEFFSLEELRLLLKHENLKYKRKESRLGLPRVEGLDGSCDWIAIHLGNILLHLFQPETRAHYDLESLWAAGPEHDEVSHGFLPFSLTRPSKSDVVDWDQVISEVRGQRSSHETDRNISSKSET